LSNKEAKLNTKKKPHMSVTVVNIGLEINAGSSFARFNNKGHPLGSDLTFSGFLNTPGLKLRK
jgi:hypothetical protein